MTNEEFQQANELAQRIHQNEAVLRGMERVRTFYSSEPHADPSEVTFKQYGIAKESSINLTQAHRKVMFEALSRHIQDQLHLDRTAFKLL